MGRIQKIREERRLEEEQKMEEKREKKKKMITWIVVGVIIFIALIYGANSLLKNNDNKTASGGETPLPTTTATAPPIFPSIAAATSSSSNQSINPSATPDLKNMNKIAIISTDKGDITLELYTKDAPKTVNNFVTLAKKKFYNGLKFHRVISDFMIQGGDPNGNGTGGPGYDFEDEINPWSLGLSEQQIASLQAEGYRYTKDLTSHKVTVGALAMANSGPDTNGSQFFIVTQKDQPHLDGRHTVFGKVIEGMDAVRKIQQGDIMKEILILN